MNKQMQKGFTLVELLVVITILAIISVVAYQNFWWATDKAISGRKISDIGTIEMALQQFKADNKYYPMPQSYDASSNAWGYSTGASASASNTIQVTYNGQEINSFVSGNGGGIVYQSGSTSIQLGAKWVIGYNGDFNKKYLSKELYDPELWDIAISSTNQKMIDKWIGKYVYGVYAQPKSTTNWNVSGSMGTYYNLAATLKQPNSEEYISYVVGDFDENACSSTSICKKSLIGNSGSLVNNTKQDNTKTTRDTEQWIPYPVTNFAK